MTVEEKIKYYVYVYDNLLDFRMILDFPGNHATLVAI